MAYIGTAPRTRPLYQFTRIVWYLLSVVETLLALRFILRLLGANPAASFTSVIYQMTYPLVAPFINVFRVSEIAGATFEWTTLLAMIVYWLIAWIIISLIDTARPTPSVE